MIGRKHCVIKAAKVVRRRTAVMVRPSSSHVSGDSDLLPAVQMAHDRRGSGHVGIRIEADSRQTRAAAAHDSRWSCIDRSLFMPWQRIRACNGPKWGELKRLGLKREGPKCRAYRRPEICLSKQGLSGANLFSSLHERRPRVRRRTFVLDAGNRFCPGLITLSVRQGHILKGGSFF